MRELAVPKALTEGGKIEASSSRFISARMIYFFTPSVFAFGESTSLEEGRVLPVAGERSESEPPADVSRRAFGSF